MEDPYIGQIQLFAFLFAPQGWVECAGQAIPISQNAALYSLIGNTYDVNNPSPSQQFMLPNLRGAEPLPQMKYYICMNGIYPVRD